MSESKNKNFLSHIQSENSLNSGDEEEMEIQEYFSNKSESDSQKFIENDINDNCYSKDPTNEINSNLFSKQMKDLEDNLKQTKLEESLKEQGN